MRPTRAEIDLDKLERNYRRLREAHAKGRLMTVLKANAYGHGMVPAARFLADLGQELFAVALPGEALELRRAGITGRILVLGAVEHDAVAECAAGGIELTVASLAHLRQVLAEPPAGGVDMHLKLDTGMGRLGLREPDIAPAAELLARPGTARLRAVYTHFAEAERLDSDYSERQWEAFNAWSAPLLAAWPGEPPELHLANSAALLRDRRFHGDYARVGFALWAPLLFDPPGAAPAAGEALEAVLTLKSRLSHVKAMAGGDTVGYGRSYRCRAGEVIGTIPIGYGDGYSRLLSTRGFVSIAGRRYALAGRVSMDQITVSLGDDHANVGDEVVLLGGCGEAAVPAAEMAGWLDTIDYEVLTQLTARIPRRYLRGGVEVPPP